MKRLAHRITLACTLVFPAASVPAYEVTDEFCETPSHGRLTLGDDYYDLAQHYTITAQTSSELHAFYQRLEGRWSGEMIDRPCTRLDDRHPRQAKYFLLPEVNGTLRDDGLFILRTEKQQIALRRGQVPTGKRQRIVSVTPNARIDFLPGGDLTALEMPDANTVTAISRYQQRNQNSASGIRTSLRERQDTLLLLGDDTLLVQTRWYVNGYYAGTESLHLTRQN